MRSVSAAVFLFVRVVGDLSSFLRIDLWSLALITVGVVLGLLIGDILYFEALSRIAVSLAAPLSSTYPLYTVVLSLALLKEKVTARLLTGTGLIILGVCLITLT